MSFFNELVELGVESVKPGTIGVDDHEALKRKIGYEWTKHNGGRDRAKKKASEGDFLFRWQFTLDEGYGRCLPTAAQVREALPDELKSDSLHVACCIIDGSPTHFTVSYTFKEHVNKHFEEEAEKKKKKKRERAAAAATKRVRELEASLETAQKRIKTLEGLLGMAEKMGGRAA
jgi:hypothetical protein